VTGKMMKIEENISTPVPKVIPNRKLNRLTFGTKSSEISFCKKRLKCNPIGRLLNHI